LIKSRRMIWGMEKTKNTYTLLEGNSEGRRPLGRSRHRCECILKWIIKDNGVWGCILRSYGWGQVMSCVPCSITRAHLTYIIAYRNSQDLFPWTLHVIMWQINVINCIYNLITGLILSLINEH
jgi:hypothetical protein